MRPGAVAAIALALTICACQSTPPRSPTAERQAYRAAVFTAAGDEIPFFLELPANCNTDRAAIVNGTERVSLPCQRLGPRVLLDFVVYGTRISADEGPDGVLTGDWAHTGAHIALDRLRFSARPRDQLDPKTRFVAAEGSRTGGSRPPDAAGTWRVTFDSGELAKFVFNVTGQVVQGTAEVPSEYGDLRFLAGNLHGSTLSVSTFDGASAYLIRSQIDDDGLMRGELVRGDSMRDAFTAVRADDFDVIDPLERVRVTSAEKRLDFPPLQTPRYQGKAVIVELFGTWCSNCNDLAPLLAELYAAHHANGLEILSVAYEISDDEAYVRARVAEYKAAHGVDWEIMIPSMPPEELLAVGPARLSAIGGVPVTLFINRDRTIRAIYTGFWGPATGATHQKAAATFRRLTQDIMSSR